MPRSLTGGLAALLVAWTGTAWAQAGGAAGGSGSSSDRPSEQDIFGGSAPAPATPAAPETPSSPDTPVAPGGPNQPTTSTPPAAAAATEAAGTERDRSILGATGGPEHLSDYQAPDNPLQIGGQIYLRAQTSAYQGDGPALWRFNAPSLLDAYFDARPNPRVRAFVLGRMSYNPTAPPSGMGMTTVGGLPTGSQGAFAGGSPTGFTTFSAARGPTSVLDQMWIRFDVAQRVFVTAGKQHVRWGTGRFWQPTDYLHLLRRNPLDVFDARQGTSMLKLHVPWEERAWNFYAFGVIEDPNTASDTLRRVAGAARAEIVIGGAEIGLDAMVKRDQKPRFGIDISTGIWDFDLYADVAIRYGQDFRTVAEVTPAMGQMCVDPATGQSIPINPLSSQYELRPLSGIKTQATFGINYVRKYNDNDLLTIGAEYFYNQPGLDDPNLYPGLLFNTSNQQMLNFFYVGRHYAALFASLPAPYSWNYTTFTLSTLGNLTDKSFVSRLDYSVTLLTHLTLEAFAGLHWGNRSGEFRGGFNIPAQTVADPNDTDPTDGINCLFYPASNLAPLLFNLGVALRMKI
jgi:hypothetical protein